MPATEENPLRRNQKRLDSICNLIHKKELLKEASIHRLADDLGDLEDAASYFLENLDDLLSSLEAFETAPRKCHHDFNSLHGWFTEFRMHMRHVAPVITRLCKEIERRYPDEFPWDKDE